jgi:tetratricopeptide (TPR) repeat protein
MNSVLIPILIVLFIFALFKAVQHEKRKTSKNSKDSFISEIQKETEKARAKNNEWAKRHNYYQDLILKAKSLEKEKNYFDAITLFEKALSFAKNDQYFQINNYAHCIDRLAINYRKTKQKGKEIKFLENALEENSNWNNSTYDRWNERLAKLI